jgi:hypothetical protein
VRFAELHALVSRMLEAGNMTYGGGNVVHVSWVNAATGQRSLS